MIDSSQCNMINSEVHVMKNEVDAGQNPKEILRKTLKRYDVGQFIEAIPYFQAAAENENADAMLHLGCMYYRGDGVPEDKSKAVMWYEKAAESGNATAMNNLGYLYFIGEGVSKDHTKALKQYQ